LQRVLDSLNNSLNTDNKEDFISVNRAGVKEEVKIKAIINAI
jgi:hypothetical protein